jgi:hypothetical protein
MSQLTAALGFSYHNHTLAAGGQQTCDKMLLGSERRRGRWCANEGPNAGFELSFVNTTKLLVAIVAETHGGFVVSASML